MTQPPAGPRSRRLPGRGANAAGKTQSLHRLGATQMATSNVSGGPRIGS
jgi:hypothetical protein